MLHLDVLGPVRVRRGGVELDLGTPRQRAIVSALALEGGRSLAVAALVERVWGNDAPDSVVATLQSYIGQLRRALEPDRAPRAEAAVLVTEHGGYALRIDAEARDDVRLQQAVLQARDLLSVVPDQLRPQLPQGASPKIAEAVSLLDEALATWRGRPYAELDDDPDVLAERARCEDLRLGAQELLIVARLALGQHVDVLPSIDQMTQAHPLHERWWTLRALALARSGRQADALATLQELRSVLDDELGVEPSPPVRELHTAILRQDPTVAWQDRAGAPSSAPSHGRTLEVVPPRSADPVAPPWPLAGRVPERNLLTAWLERSSQHGPQAGWLAGEAGIGKTRLTQELALAAHRSGVVVARGTCGQAGAPSLWPWRQVLDSIAAQSGTEPDLERLFADDPEDFAVRTGLTAHLRDAARDRPVLVLLEDVHDADVATLQMLAHVVDAMADSMDGTSLAVLATRRAGAGNEELLQPVSTAIARHGGLRIDLDGLAPADARELVDLAVGGDLDRRTVADLTTRSGGNPYFLVELARSGGRLNGSLVEVVAARLSGLPPATREALTAAAVLGDDVAHHLLALTLDLGSHELEERLVAAAAAGTIQSHESRVPRLSFAHGVVREVLLGSLGPAERSRWHARAAVTLDDHADLRRIEQRSALALHWEAAGVQHAGAGWRSLLRAAELAGRDRAHREAADLLARAAALQELDPAHTDRERYELLMLLVDDQRWAGQWSALGDTVDRAVASAERLGDPALTARAAMATVEGAIWQVRTYGVVHWPLVAALERAVDQLDSTDAPVGLRARARIALAIELYYAQDTPRVDELVINAVELARNDGDPRLLSIVLAGGFSARWRTDTLGWRRTVAEETVAAADELGDARHQCLARTLTVAVAIESGDLAAVRRLLPPTLELARHLGLVTAQAVLLAAAAPLHSMTGDDAAAQQTLEEATEVAQHSRLPNFDRAMAGTAALAALWSGDLAALAAQSAAFDATGDEGVSMRHIGPWILVRIGMVDLARTVFVDPDVDLSRHAYTFLANACLACELGLGLDLPDLAARGYAAAAAHAGLMASGGSAMALGPVDGFLALGALAAGDREQARRHAEDAIDLARSWGLPRYVTWVEQTRAAHAF
ncbi:hypothetical protein ASE01_08300 [Nocardioides sp. Root190]|uniref:BTAD domain-containing putative transcriptional regulator n=1 Tax=Nocardioides sp. Root190 TaxID=1736488 RepID=UPI0006F64F8C|nr:BTAD domain-containing putative transcriptional regulator [Nocardioides sp. Root190]KRB78144.1 hypothetical protein ASE01_08300 [Nocardioides sp. Root190]